MTIITIAAAGIATVLLAVQLKGLKGEYAAYMVMAAGAFIFFYGTGKLKDILEALERIQGYIKVNSVYLVTLLKMVGITYVAEFASGICKDAGYGSLETRLKYSGSCPFWVSVCPFCWRFLGHWRHFWDEEMEEMGSQERGPVGPGSAVCRSPGMGRRTCLRRFGGGTGDRHWRGTGPRPGMGHQRSAGGRDRGGPGFAGHGTSG